MQGAAGHVERLDPVGERFDPNFHQAMFEVPNSGQEPGTVVQVLQPGYELLGRLVRPAMVVVAAKGAGDAATGGSNPYAANDGDQGGGSLDTRA